LTVAEMQIERSETVRVVRGKRTDRAFSGI
jgi:hypothetical protein